jgi:hypothetical protein
MIRVMLWTIRVVAWTYAALQLFCNSKSGQKDMAAGSDENERSFPCDNPLRVGGRLSNKAARIPRGQWFFEQLIDVGAKQKHSVCWIGIALTRAVLGRF